MAGQGPSGAQPLSVHQTISASFSSHAWSNWALLKACKPAYACLVALE